MVLSFSNLGEYNIELVHCLKIRVQKIPGRHFPFNALKGVIESWIVAFIAWRQRTS